jgi:hypothetical protein
MKTLETNAMTSGWIDKAAVKRIALWTAIYLGIIWVLAPLFERPVVQPIRNAWVLTGQGLASFPMWGYSLLIRLLGSVSAVVMLQSVLGALATAALMVRLNCLAPGKKALITPLFILSLPWLSFIAYAYQLPISSAFMILTLLAMEMAIRSGRITWGIVAGVLGACGQSFRSELLLLPGSVLLVVLILRKLQWFRCPSIKPLAVCVGMALMLQMPWALNCYFNAGRFSLTESNLGHVAFLGLGKLPSNPWNIVNKDAFAQETVNKAGLGCSSLSFQGSDFLRSEFLKNVRQHPAAYMQCIGARVGNMIFRPFTYVRLVATPPDGASSALVRIIGPFMAHTVAANPETGPKSDSVSKIKVVCVVLMAFFLNVLMSGVSILGIVGFFLAMGKAPFQLSQGLILCLGVTLLYRLGINVALSDNRAYMTGVYLCYLPFAVNTLSALSQRWLRPGSAGRVVASVR